MSKFLTFIFTLSMTTAISFGQTDTDDLIAENQRMIKLQDSLFDYVNNENIVHIQKGKSIQITEPNEATIMLAPSSGILEAIINETHDNDDQDYAAYLLLCVLSKMEFETYKTPTLNEFKQEKKSYLNDLDEWIDKNTMW